jgi:hypothetical protein
MRLNKTWLSGFFFSFPVQLFLLHFKKHQLLLFYWIILFSTIQGSFMRMFGAYSLFLAPEYLDSVNALAAAMVGMATGVFIMSWNITTFILYSRHIKFLATTRRPFVTYCLNNFIIPVGFLIYYLVKAINFGLYKELFSVMKVTELAGGFVLGLLLIILLSFLYFFRADRNISRKIAPILSMPFELSPEELHKSPITGPGKLVKVTNYLALPLRVAPVRDVQHYNRVFIETIFNRHHFAAVILIVFAFFYMIGISFFLDNNYFQFPAAASITVFFSILIAVFGAFSYFLQNWSLLVTVAVLFLLNLLYRAHMIDPTNKAYGIGYGNENRPAYTPENINSLCTPEKMEADKQKMEAVLDRWKRRQQQEKPVMFLINVSGGGSRSAVFTMNILQHLDEISQGRLMKQTFLINGASGGMLGATYFRELYRRQQKGSIKNIRDDQYSDDISKDLLNPIFSSLVARDLLSPAQKFSISGNTYLKDRAYAFEEKLNENTRYLLSGNLASYADEETDASIPMIFFNSVITRDGRKMIASTQPVSFMMKPPVTDSLYNPEPDAIDFAALFAGQSPQNLRLLTAMRMNATFPYILPNVWLPSEPVIDVMDAGLRDNYGQESTTRFIRVFEDWLKKNVSKVVLITIRDRKTGNWDHPYESKSLAGIFSKPMTQLQYNWVKVQDYMQNNDWSTLQKTMGAHLGKIVFQYAPVNQKKGAALSFHLTNSEKKEIKENIFNPFNQKSFEEVKKLLAPVP